MPSRFGHAVATEKSDFRRSIKLQQLFDYLRRMDVTGCLSG